MPKSRIMKVVPPKSTPGNAAAMSSPRSSANRPGVSHSSAAPALGRGSPSTPADSADNDCEVEHWAAIAQAYIWRGDAGRSNLFRRTTLSQPPADQPEAARLPPQGWGLDCSIPLLEGGFVGALVEPWGGFGVAIRWLPDGFQVALGWLWVALGGFARRIFSSRFGGLPCRQQRRTRQSQRCLQSFQPRQHPVLQCVE